MGCCFLSGGCFSFFGNRNIYLAGLFSSRSMGLGKIVESLKNHALRDPVPYRYSAYKKTDLPKSISTTYEKLPLQKRGVDID